MVIKYSVKKSKYSKNYYYITEIKTDEFGTTEDRITKALYKDELNDLSNKIQLAISK